MGYQEVSVYDFKDFFARRNQSRELRTGAEVTVTSSNDIPLHTLI